MKKLLLIIPACLLTACLSGVWTGASLFYSRHDVYKKITDVDLESRAHKAISNQGGLHCPTCVIDVTAFNETLLVSGHVPTLALKDKLKQRLAHLPDCRHLYFKINVSNEDAQAIEDSWITMKIRSQIVQNADLDPNAFKVVTTDGIVYLLGEVHVNQARVVIHLARETKGVRKVVVLFNYYLVVKQAF